MRSTADEADENDEATKVDEDDEAAKANEAPFCCARMQIYHPRRTEHDATFKSFVDATGDAPGLVFQVKKQVDNGPMIWEKFFTLKDGVRAEVKGPFTQKVHSYKNYKCTDCDRFFGVDLYKDTNAVGGNYHHMRVNAYGRRNRAIERAVFF